MRSQLGIVVCAILFTGFSTGSSVPMPRQVPINLGDRLIVQVLTYSDHIRKCYLDSPSGTRIEFKPADQSDEKFTIQSDTDVSQCRAAIRIDETDSGLWTLTSESFDERERVQIYNITVNAGDSHDKKDVEYLDKQIINTTLGATHKINIPDFIFGETKTCEIAKPDGGLYSVQELDAMGDEIISKDVVTKGCSIVVKVASERAIGRWMLISDGVRLSERIERRLPFEIGVEEAVLPSIDVINVKKGNNMYLTLKNSISERYVKTCRLRGPGGASTADYHLVFRRRCGFKVSNVTTNDTGNWEISYGDTVKYRAIVNVTVHDAPAIEEIKLNWTKDKSVYEIIGPENAIYCRVKSPEGFEMFNGFGRCKIILDRVIKSQHEGLWHADVGLPGQVLTHSFSFTVVVQDAAPKATVHALVNDDKTDKRTVTLSCSLGIQEAVQSCKFRDPSGRILIAAEGVGESRYSWHGTGVNYTTGVHQRECSLRIVNTTTSEFGIWRCALDTHHDIYYGFLTVRPLWIRDPEIVAAIVTKPTLTADRSSISSVVGDSVTMSCSIRAPIRYCYFRSRNGTVFNVAPSAHHDFASYAGAGLDAGECGIRFPSLATSDSGYWSCHVGLMDPMAQEQRARFEVTINDSMVVTQSMDIRATSLTLQAQVNNGRPLEYCRFVRIDGFGFTDANVPSTINNWSDLSRGKCAINILHPTSLEQHPWAIVARIRGQDTEITRITDIAFQLPSPPGGGSVQLRIPGAWIIVMSIGMCMILLASFIGPKKNREWTYARANALRNSFMTKKAEQNSNVAARNTAVAA